MNKYTPHPDKVLILINSKDRKSMFEKDIICDDGRVISLVTSIQLEEAEDGSHAQSVQTGVVLEVGVNVSWIKKGDTAVLDYTVDITPENVAYVESDGSKAVCLKGCTSYYDSTFFIPANKNRQYDQFVYRKGEMNEPSMIIAAIREGKVIPNNPYIILEYRKPKNNFTRIKDSLFTAEITERLVERKVVCVSENSKLKVGDLVVVESDSLFDRDANGSIVSVVYEQDILALSE